MHMPGRFITLAAAHTPVRASNKVKSKVSLPLCSTNAKKEPSNNLFTPSHVFWLRTYSDSRATPVQYPAPALNTRCRSIKVRLMSHTHSFIQEYSTQHNYKSTHTHVRHKAPVCLVGVNCNSTPFTPSSHAPQYAICGVQHSTSSTTARPKRHESQH